MAKTRYRCPRCGSDSVQVAAWIDPNTLEVLDDVSDGADGQWCEECEAHVILELFEEGDA